MYSFGPHHHELLKACSPLRSVSYRKCYEPPRRATVKITGFLVTREIDGIPNQSALYVLESRSVPMSAFMQMMRILVLVVLVVLPAALTQAPRPFESAKLTRKSCSLSGVVTGPGIRVGRPIYTSESLG